ncbi:MAG: DUF86 domain-containing protein [Anaerolineae bacterium]|nr:DUF86 domain-containing protein [Anaerolineae bacterium]
MNEQDEVRLRHMLDAAQEVQAFVADCTRDDLNDNQMLVRALSMSIGIIGEAASHVSQEFREAHPEIPWPQIIGMRNRIIHAYFEVNLDILWETATDSIL